MPESGRTFQRERITDLWAELEPLAAAHQAEAGTGLPLKLDRHVYEAFEASGLHHFATVRIDGEMVGYCSTKLCTSHLDGAMQAHEDAIFVVARHRGYIGSELERFVDHDVARLGAKQSYRERVIKTGQADRALRRGPFGYRPHSVLFVRDLPAAEA